MTLNPEDPSAMPVDDEIDAVHRAAAVRAGKDTLKKIREEAEASQHRMGRTAIRSSAA